MVIIRLNFLFFLFSCVWLVPDQYRMGGLAFWFFLIANVIADIIAMLIAILFLRFRWIGFLLCCCGIIFRPCHRIIGFFDGFWWVWGLLMSRGCWRAWWCQWRILGGGLWGFCGGVNCNSFLGGSFLLRGRYWFL